jgi:large repetitive protein
MTNHLCSIIRRHLLYAASLQSKQHFKVKNLASFCFILLFYLVLGQDMAWGQTLGNYPYTVVTAGQNTIIEPSAAPSNATSIVAYCSYPNNTNFRGVLTVNPTTGVVRVTDALQAGNYTVTVKAFGTTPTTATFPLSIAAPAASQVRFGLSQVSVGKFPNAVAIGDFNEDGHQDLALANRISETVSIRLGDGQGGFSGTTDVSVGSDPHAVAIGDFNGDGHQDLAVANNGAASVSIRLGDGMGGFSSATDVSVGADPKSVAIGDFNGDGHQDLAVANNGSSSVSIRLGNGMGGFSSATDVSVGSDPRSVAVGDFNVDGSQDLAVANRISNTVSIRLGNGNGGFSGTTEVEVGSNPFGLAIGDFNGDGSQDLAVANNGSSSVSIRLGNGMGGFSSATEVSAGDSPYGLAIGDFNGDGNQDLAVASGNGLGTVSIVLCDGQGGFSGTTAVSVGYSPYGLAIGDFNGDGHQDLAVPLGVGSESVSILISGGPIINVQGNGIDIEDGDTSASETDGTDFGNVSVSLTRTFTIRNTGNVALTISGINSTDSRFVVSGAPSSVVAGSSGTFDVAFVPMGFGVQNATITINSNDPDKGVYDFAVKGLPIPCNSVLSSLNVTLDGNCQFNLTPQMVAAGPCTYVNYRVVVQDNNQGNGGTIDCAGTWTYGLFDIDGHLVGWGKVTAEDKTAPLLVSTDFFLDTLDCFDVNYVLNNPMTIGNVSDGPIILTNSPKPAATSTQTILYAEGEIAPENFTTDDKIKNLGWPNFQDNCRSCGCRVTLKWSDKVVYYGCDSISATGIYARIYREWVATDCNGMRSSVVQVIPFARPDVVLDNGCGIIPAPFSNDNLKFRGPKGTCGAAANVAAPGYDWVVQYTSCTPDKSLIQKVDVMPSFRSYFYNSATTATKRDIYLDEAECNYSVQIKDTEFPTCGGKGLKIDREIYVFDWCAGGVIDTFHVLIKITDDKAPTLTAPAFVNGAPYRNPAQTPTVEISTGPMDCTAAFPITVAGIKKTFGYTIADNCTLGNVTMSVKTKDRYVKGILVAENTWDKVDYAIMNNSMIGLPTGYHRLIVDMSDGCYNAKRDSFEFYVYDGIAPVMKCDDQLNVSLSNGNGYTTGYAQVTVEDLNEGSWDNCKLVWIKARRNVPTALAASFIAKGYDSNNNGKLDAAVGNDINADGDYNDYINGVEEELKDGADGIDINGDGDFADFGETFVLKGGKLMTPLTDVVEFFCGDVAAKVVVELWGSDNAYGYDGEIDGNRSFCWEEILIEDKVAPACVAPFDITVDCDEKCLEKIDNKAVSALCFGDVTITSGNDCAALDTVYSVSKDLKCGYGTIVRSWALTKQTAKGPITINCAQTITVRAIHQYNICFPKDASADCKTPIIDTIITDELSCDILSVNVSDKRYDASDDECYKIFRTYSVINWCTYDDVCGDPLDQTNVTVIDRGYFGNYGKAPLYLLVRDSDRDLTEEFYISENLTPNELDDYHFATDGDINGIDSGSGFKSTPNGQGVPYCNEVEEYKHSFIYTQIIKVYDDTRPVVTGATAKFCIRDGGDCLANLKMVINGKDNCSDKVTLETNVLMIAPYQTLDASKMIMYSSPKWSTKDLGNGDFEINVKDLAPLGVHDLIVVVRDECGNLSVPTRIPFTIADCKGPAPICINGLSTDLMSDGNGAGMMAVWASDFVASKVYDCNGQGPEVKDGLKLVTKYSLNRVGSPKDKNVTGINLTCADKGKVILVELHAWDEAGNDDFCVTYVEVQDNRNVCPGSTTGGSFNIAGTISTEGTANLQGAAITLSGQTSMSATTTANGGYSFVNLAKGGDFTIAPQLDKNHLNGVSTFDLVLIQKHILNVVALNSPYKMIAADVNNSKSITTLDLIALRKLILNIDQSFQNNTSWRFVDATYKFPTASNPWSAAFPEVVSVNDLAANTTANFVAIKVGDVNASATVSSATAAEVRTNGTLDINAAEAALKAGQEYSVEFSAADLKNVQGYQFALNLDKRKVELVDIVYGVAKAENFGVFASEGIITTSWNSEVKQGALFTLVLRAKADAQLSSALSLNRIVAAEAYNGNNDQLDLALTFNKTAVNNGFELKQNTPNPFNGETVINFNLPKATAATLTISDVTGRILKSVRATYAKGLNQVTLKASDLNASGVLYYTLEADDFTATKKMILVSE